MKKIIFSLIALVFVSVTILSCSGNETKHENHGDMNMTTETGVQYTCSMHPEVISDKPGKCPKCGMTLIKKEKSDMMPDSTMKGDSSMKM